jgi:heterodisulfide reductase subunit A
MSDSVLVIGGGIAGIQASLDLANSGARVVLVEREPTIGGAMAVLDKNFPTLDCSICIEAPKMSEVDLHPNIEILSLAEIVSLQGEPGDFQVRIHQKSRYVSDECTRCGDCVQACPVVLPNEFDSGMAARRAIYTPIPQAVPGAYVIDVEHCLNDPPNYLPCDRCHQACPPKAIRFLVPRESLLDRTVGSVVVSVGYDSLDPRRLPEFGYGRHPDVLTALEFERLINSAGPTEGEILRPSDGRPPENLLIVLCVGSRDRRIVRYCSRMCCMYSIKHAYQALEHGIRDVTVLYMDIRAFGKGFDGFWRRTREAGAKFVRGRPSRIEPNGSGRIRACYEDTARAARVIADYDMVVLANAVLPPSGLPDLANRLGIELEDDGFVRALATDGSLVATTRPGVYAAGCTTGPKDIPDSVAEGSGAAARALRHLRNRHWPEPVEVEPMEGIETPRLGVFVCHCGSNIAGVVDVERVVQAARAMPDVVYAAHQMFSCAGNTQKDIERTIRAERINRVVVAACSPKTHESIFRGVMVRSGLNPYLLEMCNIRNLDSWVHRSDKEAATTKAVDMVWMSVEKARQLVPLESRLLPLTQSALVVGGGIAGMSAATALAHQGFKTHLVEPRSQLGGLLAQLDDLAPAGIKAGPLVQAKAHEVDTAGVDVHLGTQVQTIGGVVGSFHARLSDGQELVVGAVVVATGADPYAPAEFGHGRDPRVITNLELETLLEEGGPEAERITFISCVGSRQGRAGCSRYCCTSMIGQAHRLRKMGKRVRLLYKEIRTYGRQAEERYEEAMRAGVQFIRYDPELPPQEAIAFRNGLVEVHDHLLGAPIRIPTDLLVLVVGLQPTDGGLADQLKLARSSDGFLMELHPKLGPAETASQGIYLAGTAQGAKDVRESIAQALAAAGKAGAVLSRGVIEKEPLTAQVIEDRCTGCMRCVKACPFGAIEQTGPIKEGRVRILEAACRGCGTCAAECNFQAIEMPYFTRGQILAQIDAALAETPQEKCLVFTCNWCSYAGADLAGIEKRQYPASARIVRTMCSARIEEGFIERAFEGGAGAVLVTGCRLTDTGSDCHYNSANRLTWKRFQHWQHKFARKEIDPERLQLRWISASEGKEFAEKMREMDDVVHRHMQRLGQVAVATKPATD